MFQIPNQYVQNSIPCSSKPQAMFSNKIASSINRNTTPKPFVSAVYEGSSNLENEFPPPPLDLLNMPSSDLKTPSEFLRDKSPLQNPSIQHFNTSSHQLKDPSNILTDDISISPNNLDKRFAPTSIMNFQNNNQIMSNSQQDTKSDSAALVSNLNNMLHDKLNTVNNEKYALNNNATSKPLDASLVQNIIPYQISNSDKNPAISQPQNSHVLHPSLFHSEDPSSSYSLLNSKNSPLQDGSIQKNSNLSNMVQHSNPIKNQEPSLSHSIYSQPQEHTFIHQPGFESAPQNYKQVPDQLYNIDESVGLLSLSHPDQFSNKAVKASPPVVKLLNCLSCHQIIKMGQVAVLAERAGNSVVWHPQCFVCHTCKVRLISLY